MRISEESRVIIHAFDRIHHGESAEDVIYQLDCEHERKIVDNEINKAIMNLWAMKKRAQCGCYKSPYLLDVAIRWGSNPITDEITIEMIEVC